ncbi:MAG: DUF465 domain-containing protein [Rhizobiales bacterium]|nr:DUF465 domain-containing protein [Hyphomicrobiales bacterium]
MSEEGEVDLEEKLEALKAQHQALHDEIEKLEEHGGDALNLTRLKKEKLQLKDQITQLEDSILPDIIA